MTQSVPRRSVLYVPAANRKAMDKAVTLSADAVIFDLEDAVAPEAKDEARQLLAEHFAAAPRTNRERVIRVNAATTSFGSGDVALAARCRPQAVLLPKVERAADLRALRQALDAAGAGDVALWAMIETPLGIVNIGEIAALGSDPAIRLQCFVAGTNDLAKETGLSLALGRPAMTAWLAPVVLHAKAHGIGMLDGVYNDFRDIDGFAAECAAAVALGFDGKTLIHPSQIEPANAAFSPGEAEIAEARAVVAAFAAPENAGKGVLTVNGRMTERLHAEMAARLLARAGLTPA